MGDEVRWKPTYLPEVDPVSYLGCVVVLLIWFPHCILASERKRVHPKHRGTSA